MNGNKVMSAGEKRDRMTRTCHHCKRVGHMEKDCWELHPEKRRGRNQKGRKTYTEESGKMASDVMWKASATTRNQGTKSSAKWYIDSACSNHMTSNKESLYDYKSLVIPIEVADGRYVNTAGVGSAKLQLYHKGKTMNVTLTSTYHVPGLADNLLSVGQVSHHC